MQTDLDFYGYAPGTPAEVFLHLRHWYIRARRLLHGHAYTHFSQSSGIFPGCLAHCEALSLVCLREHAELSPMIHEVQEKTVGDGGSAGEELERLKDTQALQHNADDGNVEHAPRFFFPGSGCMPRL
jgi:hypothetical protein